MNSDISHCPTTKFMLERCIWSMLALSTPQLRDEWEGQRIYRIIRLTVTAQTELEPSQII